MANHKESLEYYEEQYGEKIEAIVVGRHYSDYYEEEDRRPVGQRDTVLTREQGLALLDVEYDNGYGGADCFPFHAWTASRVFFVWEYDGSTGIIWVPRNPDGKDEPEFY